MSARRGAAVAALLAAAAPAVAFVRSTTGDPNIVNPPSDPTKGVCLWRANPVVTYEVSTSGLDKTGCADQATALALVQQSFAAWNNQACSSLHYSDGGTTATTAAAADGQNLVVFRKGFCRTASGGVNPAADPNNCWDHDNAGTLVGTIALTTTHFRPDTGEIVEADMELRGWSGTPLGASNPQGGSPSDGWYFTCGDLSARLCTSYGQATCRSMDIGTTVTHEAGHMLGLDHVCAYPNVPASTCAPSSVMNVSASVGDIHRTLAQDDVNGVCAIYPAGATTGNPTNGCLATGGAQKSGGGGCATGGAGDLGLLGLALLALRRRYGGG